MQDDSNGQSANRPYAPPSNIIAVLRRLRDRKVPSHLDGDYLRDMQISEGTITRALFGLKFLKLVDDDFTPTPALRSISISTDEEYQETLSALVREAYSDVFERLDPTQDTQDKFYNFFRRYTPASQRERMVIFFLGMCREAGMQLADAPRQRGVAATPRATSTRSATRDKVAPKKQRQSQISSNQRKVEADDTGDVPPALLLLVRSLPPAGSALSETKRDQWLDMARAALAYTYPEVLPANDDGEIGEDVEGGDDADV